MQTTAPMYTELLADVECVANAILQFPPTGEDDERNRLFGQFGTILAAMPLSSADYLFASNWVNTARELWMQGEVQAARYQLGQVVRRIGLNDQCAEPVSPRCLRA